MSLSIHRAHPGQAGLIFALLCELAEYEKLTHEVEASEGDIRNPYRKLIRENHPDRLASKGLPESMRAVAEERTREINAAFDLIKKTRQFA